MKKTYIPAGRMLEHKPKFPERTAYRAARGASFDSQHWGDVEIVTFTNVLAMEKCIQLQRSSANWAQAYQPWPAKVKS